jgi:hypothetical protein
MIANRRRPGIVVDQLSSRDTKLARQILKGEPVMKKTMLIPLVLLLALVLAAGAVAKDDRDRPVVDVPYVPGGAKDVGDDCDDPLVITELPYYGTGLTTCGRGNTYPSGSNCLGSYAGGEDIIFQLDLAEETTIQIHLTTASTWTGLAIDNQCPLGTECIAVRTGSSGNKSITNLTLPAGSYFIMVDTWPSPNCIPDFDLTIEFDDPPPPPPVNDDCAGAIDLRDQGLTEFEIDLCLYQHFYSPGPSGNDCTGYPATGPEAVYKIYLQEGEPFSACITPSAGFIDLVLYMVTDCADPEGSCVAGDDSGNPECIEFEAPVEGWYYMMVDTYTTCGAGLTTVTVEYEEVVATTHKSWSNIKSLYR